MWGSFGWRYCCSGEVIEVRTVSVELLARGLPGKALAENNVWWNGPSWLTLSCLPNQRQLHRESVEKERKTRTDKNMRSNCLEPVIDPSQYERWLTLIWVTAYLLRCVAVINPGQVRIPKNCQLREAAECQVELVPADTDRRVPSGVWTAKGEPSPTKYQCYIEVGSLLRRERSIAAGRRDYSTRTYKRVLNIQLSCRSPPHGIKWMRRSYRVCTMSCFMLDPRVPCRFYDKRFGSQ